MKITVHPRKSFLDRNEQNKTKANLCKQNMSHSDPTCRSRDDVFGRSLGPIGKVVVIT